MTEIKHIIWDWNGTLLDDAWLCVELMNDLLDEHGLPRFDLKKYQEIFTFPVSRYYEMLGFDRKNFSGAGTAFIEAYERRRNELSLRPGANDLLHTFHDMGIGQSILSAYKQDTLIELIDRFGLSDWFQHLSGLDNHYAEGKMTTGKVLVERLGLKREYLLLVGDTIHDHEVAAALGISCILVQGGHQSSERLLGTGRPVVEGLDYLVISKHWV